MNTRSKRLWAGTFAVGLAGLAGLTAITASAPADGAKRGLEGPTISMEFDGISAPRFEGPSTIPAGANLTVVNNTAVEEIGPHTFSLIEKKELPQTRQEAKDCFKGKSKVCKRIFKAHKVDFETFEVGKPLVEKGAEGWDTSFGKDQSGDSWYTETEGEEFSQTVPLSAGEKFVYFCVVHPEMAGKLKAIDVR